MLKLHPRYNTTAEMTRAMKLKYSTVLDNRAVRFLTALEQYQLTRTKPEAKYMDRGITS